MTSIALLHLALVPGPGLVVRGLGVLNLRHSEPWPRETKSLGLSPGLSWILGLTRVSLSAIQDTALSKCIENQSSK